MTDALPRQIHLPADLLPSDGRFGCGPSKVRPEAVDALVRAAPGYLGTSHRQAPVKSVVRAVREGLSTLFGLPDGYEVALGNGGSTLFWDAATFGLIATRSEHLSFGEFSSKFAAAAQAAPHISGPLVVETPVGTRPAVVVDDAIDAYCFTHNETSTGVAMPLERPPTADALVVVDATSAAGGIEFDPAQVDAYYFAPQKCFASDGGLWVALLSPAAVERIERLSSSRWTPASLDLSVALENSRLDQTLNTPALATLFLLRDQVDWMNGNGGLAWAAGRSRASSDILYTWAEKSSYATPFAGPDDRSPVVGTIDLDRSVVEATDVCAALRANGIVDTDAYRKLGRNQVRVGMFPAVEPDDVEALTACIDHVVNALTA